MIEILHFVQNDNERFRMTMNIRMTMNTRMTSVIEYQNDICHPEQSEGSIK